MRSTSNGSIDLPFDHHHRRTGLEPVRLSALCIVRNTPHSERTTMIQSTDFYLLSLQEMKPLPWPQFRGRDRGRIRPDPRR